MVEIQSDYESRGVQLVAINSNDDGTYPQDSYPEMVKRAKEKGFNFVYLRDADQTTVDAYGAVCTPHVFLFDAEDPSLQRPDRQLRGTRRESGAPT